MAVQSFEEVIQSAQLSAEERKILDNAIAKMPALKEGWLRQDDYSRKQTELSTERKKFDSDLEYAQRMKAWSETALPVWDNLKAAGIVDEEGNEIWTAQKTKLENDLAEAVKAGVGGEMDPAELDKRVRAIVKENGGVTPEELKALVAAEGKKLVEEGFAEQWKAKETDFNSKTIPFVAGFSAATAVVASKFEKESGESWTPERQQELFKMMSDDQVFDPFKYQERLIAPFKQKKDEEARIEAEVQKRVKAYGLPEGGGEGFIPQDGPKGSLQMALEREAGPGDFEALIKSQSVKAATELRSEGKG